MAASYRSPPWQQRVDRDLSTVTPEQMKELWQSMNQQDRQAMELQLEEQWPDPMQPDIPPTETTPLLQLDSGKVPGAKLTSAIVCCVAAALLPLLIASSNVAMA